MRALVVAALVVIGCDSKPTPNATDPVPPPPGDAAVVIDALAPVLGPRVPDLVVTVVSPDSGDADGGTYVIVKGRGFTSAPRTAKVRFGTSEGTFVRFSSDTEMIVQAPAGTSGDSVDVVVEFDPGGTLRLPAAFRYRDAVAPTGTAQTPPAMEQKALEVVLELGAVFARAGTDCDKLADELEAFLDKHEGELKGYKDYEKTLPAAAKQRFNRKIEDAMKPMMDKMTASLTACVSDARVSEALKRMTNF